MQTSEFSIFQSLLHDVHQKAFGEPLSTLPHGKAQALSFFIEETTGQVLSYKTLGNFVSAALCQSPDSVNPNVSTLSILVRFLHEQSVGNDAVIWYQYRSRAMQQESAVAPQTAPWKVVGGYGLGRGQRAAV
ncbi:MAG: hypothetical protein ACKVU2_16800 [Saprospiraceae bacterium]